MEIIIIIRLFTCVHVSFCLLHKLALTHYIVGTENTNNIQWVTVATQRNAKYSTQHAQHTTRNTHNQLQHWRLLSIVQVDVLVAEPQQETQRSRSAHARHRVHTRFQGPSVSRFLNRRSESNWSWNIECWNSLTIVHKREHTDIHTFVCMYTYVCCCMLLTAQRVWS